MAIFTIGTTSTSSIRQIQDTGWVASSFDVESWTGNTDPQTGRQLYVLYAAFANAKYYDSTGNEKVQFFLGRTSPYTDKVTYTDADQLLTSGYGLKRFGLTEANKETLLGSGTNYWAGINSPSSSGFTTTRTNALPGSWITSFGTTGNGQQYIEFYVYGLPNKANTPTATVTGTSSVSLSWTAATAPDSRGTPTHYAVRYRVSGTSTWTSLYRTTTSTSKSITGLSPDTTYEFQVAAQNGISTYSGFNVSTGAWSNTRTATTDTDIVIDRPTFSGSFGTGTVNQSPQYDDQVNILNADSVFTRSGHSIPPGLIQDTDWKTYYRLYGTPTTSGTYSIRLNATNDGGTTVDPDDELKIDPEPVPDDPVWGTQSYADMYVGLEYSSQVTAQNAISYAITSGSLPAGLSLSTANGTISGRPEQPTTPTELSSKTFTITAYGETGTTAQPKEFTVDFLFPGRTFTNSSGGSDYLSIARRLNDSNQWEPIQRARRWNGSSWVDVTIL